MRETGRVGSFYGVRPVFGELFGAESDCELTEIKMGFSTKHDTFAKIPHKPTRFHTSTAVPSKSPFVVVVALVYPLPKLKFRLRLLVGRDSSSDTRPFP